MLRQNSLYIFNRFQQNKMQQELIKKIVVDSQLIKLFNL